MQFTRATFVAAAAAAVITVGAPDRADAQQPTRPDSVARRDSIARADSIAAARRTPTGTPSIPVRKEPTAPARTTPATPTPTPTPAPTPMMDPAAPRDTMQMREAAGDVAITAERLVIVVDSADARATALETATVSNVQLVSVADIVEAQLVADALTRNDAALARLRTALIANEAIAQALANNQPAVTAPQVVAVEMLPAGNVVVYYRPMP